VKYGYVQKELTNDEVEFLKLFEEEIEVRLNYRDQMRRWEIFLVEEGYKRGTIDKTLFIKKDKNDIMLVSGICGWILHLWFTKMSCVMNLEASNEEHILDEVLTPKTSHLHAVKRIFRGLISWQCKKQTIMATSTTEAEYVAAANYCGQVLWIQNQMLDYGFNFMNTKIYIDNESTICIVKNPVFHSKTKHIEIRHHLLGML
ncbi:hypothetical protein Tco_0511368, partial [Tanacetum coccineum]